MSLPLLTLGRGIDWVALMNNNQFSFTSLSLTPPSHFHSHVIISHFFPSSRTWHFLPKKGLSQARKKTTNFHFNACVTVTAPTLGKYKIPTFSFFLKFDVQSKSGEITLILSEIMWSGFHCHPSHLLFYDGNPTLSFNSPLHFLFTLGEENFSRGGDDEDHPIFLLFHSISFGRGKRQLNSPGWGWKDPWLKERIGCSWFSIQVFLVHIENQFFHPFSTSWFKL